MNAAPLCQQCLAAGIIAPAGGPTCRHTREANGWWPKDFAQWAEPQRVAWVEARALQEPAAIP